MAPLIECSNSMALSPSGLLPAAVIRGLCPLLLTVSWLVDIPGRPALIICLLVGEGRDWKERREEKRVRIKCMRVEKFKKKNAFLFNEWKTDTEGENEDEAVG